MFPFQLPIYSFLLGPEKLTIWASTGKSPGSTTQEHFGNWLTSSNSLYAHCGQPGRSDNLVNMIPSYTHTHTYIYVIDNMTIVPS